MNILRSARKSWKLRRIAKMLAYPTDPNAAIDELMHSVGSTVPTRKDTALERLLDLCEADPNVSRVMQEHRITRSDLEHLYYWQLGFAHVWSGGHWIAASAIAYPASLEFVLRHRHVVERGRLLQLAARLRRYFSSWEAGPIEENY
jgi:hypothetical protein